MRIISTHGLNTYDADIHVLKTNNIIEYSDITYICKLNLALNLFIKYQKFDAIKKLSEGFHPKDCF